MTDEERRMSPIESEMVVVLHVNPHARNDRSSRLSVMMTGDLGNRIQLNNRPRDSCCSSVYLRSSTTFHASPSIRAMRLVRATARKL